MDYETIRTNLESILTTTAALSLVAIALKARLNGYYWGNGDNNNAGDRDVHAGTGNEADNAYNKIAAQNAKVAAEWKAKRGSQWAIRNLDPITRAIAEEFFQYQPKHQEILERALDLMQQPEFAAERFHIETGLEDIERHRIFERKDYLRVIGVDGRHLRRNDDDHRSLFISALLYVGKTKEFGYLQKFVDKVLEPYKADASQVIVDSQAAYKKRAHAANQ